MAHSNDNRRAEIPPTVYGAATADDGWHHTPPPAAPQRRLVAKASHNQLWRNGFTLIELLVVIVILSILMGILLHVFARTREKGRRVTCINNLKQIDLCLLSYKQDYNDRDVGWISLLYPDYLKSKNIYKCPSDANPPGTAANAWLARIDGQHAVTYDREGSIGLDVGCDPDTRVGYVSYFYEFSNAKCEWGLAPEITPPAPYSWGELKEIQLKQGGDGYHDVNVGYEESWFPVIRCFWHLDNLKNFSPSRLIPNSEQPVYNFGFGGNVFMSKAKWEDGVW